MTASTAGSVNRWSRRSSRAAATAMLLLLSACGGSGDAQSVVSTVVSTVDRAATPAATTTTRPAATTTAATTTIRPTTTTAAPTTSTATTTTTETIVATLPSTTTSTLVVEPVEPVEPPLDAWADEPIVELGSIVIPKIGVDMTMFEGIRLSTLDHGPGHWPGTAMPGQAGNVVVGGHRVSKHRVFRNVDQLVAGDEIIFRDGAGEHIYAVNRVEIVDPTAVWIVDPTDTPTATLFACHPPGSTSQRIVVFADLVQG